MSPFFFPFLLLLSLLPASSKLCTSPFLNYDLLDDIIFLNESIPIPAPQPLCGLNANDDSCCSELNIQDVALFYEKMKYRIEDYSSNFFLNFKNLLNPFLDLHNLGITEVPSGLDSDLRTQILRYRKEIQDLNKKLARCVGGALSMFAGMMCMSCKPDWEGFINVNNPNILDTIFSDYVIKIEENNCKKLYQECEGWITGRKDLNEKIEVNVAKMIDILTAYVGGVPYERINQLDARFTNSTTKRILSEEGLNFSFLLPFLFAFSFSISLLNRNLTPKGVLIYF